MAKKVGIWLLAAILMMNGFSWEVMAAGNGGGQESEHMVTDISETWLNPMYKGMVNTADFPKETDFQESRAGSGASDFVSMKKASAYMCSHLVNRDSTITVRVQTDISNLSSLAASVFKKAVAVNKNTPGCEGDYIFYHVAAYQVNVSYAAVGRYTLTYTVKYLSTRAQETKVTARVNSLLSSLGVKKMTTYGKIKTIYDYICRNVSYDRAGVNDSSVGKFTAYNALFKKKAVCQGYASLFYRMAVESGVSARVIPGSSRSEPHAWNIVKLGSSYYNVDSTWDAGKRTYNYFLKNNQEFSDHVRDAEYQAQSFQRTYPVSVKSYKISTNAPIYSLAKAKVSGIKNKIYNGRKQTQKAVLKMNGAVLKQGRDYKVTYKNNLKAGTAAVIFTGKGRYSGTLRKNFKIVLKRGSVHEVKSYKYRITNKGDSSGTVCLIGTVNQKKSSIKVPDRIKISGQNFKITSISAKAFKNYRQLEKVSIGTNVVKIGDQAFCGAEKLKTIVVKSKKLKAVGNKAFYGIHKNAGIQVESQALATYKVLLKSGEQTGNVKIEIK